MNVDKGVPIPQSLTGRKKTHIAHKMDVGDSVLLKGETKSSCGAVQNFRNVRKDCRFTARAVDGGVRVWRIA